MQFAWDENFLYFYLKATDDSVIARRSGRNIWQDDALELFINPDGEGLVWKNPKDFQIGFRVKPGDNSVDVWSWFQDEDPSKNNQVSARGYAYETGYLIEGAVAWNYLGIRPKAGMVLRLSPAVHDVDRDGSEGKAEWFFRNEKEWKRFQLGKVVLEDKITQAVKPSKGEIHG